MSPHLVDAQVHIWAADTPERPWPKRHAPHREVPLGADELIARMDEAGVAGAMLVPPSWEGARNDLVLDACRRYPGRFAAMGCVDVNDPVAVAGMLDWRSHPGAAGFRFSLHRAGLAETLADGRMEQAWRNAEEAGAPVMLLLPQARMAVVDDLARRFPRLRIILDHLGVPSTVPLAQRFSDIGQLLALARHDNVAVKATALPSLAADPYPHRSMHGPLRQVVQAFGAERVFWGTDFSRLPYGYRHAITMFTEEMPWLSARELELVLGRGLEHWLGMEFKLDK